TNIYSVDVKGTGAGGAFTTVLDIENFWFGLLNGNIISQRMVREMLTPQVREGCYGYGVWLKERGHHTFIPQFEGCDPGVSFISSFDMENDMIVTLVSNFGCNVWELHKKINNIIN
ncbi:MAG: serine hydrolase, partial [Firmicutes bacterium]|nr:serine hydrolase [Bacillota bacterium]